MKPIKTFIIRHKETKKQWTASSGKTCWKQTNHAKNTWANSNQHWWRLTCLGIVPDYGDKPERNYNIINHKFDKQDQYEIVELKDDNDVLIQEVESVLKSIINDKLEAIDIHNKLNELYIKVKGR